MEGLIFQSQSLDTSYNFLFIYNLHKFSYTESTKNKYSRLPLSRTRTISNIALSRTKLLVPLAPIQAE